MPGGGRVFTEKKREKKGQGSEKKRLWVCKKENFRGQGRLSGGFGERKKKG